MGLKGCPINTQIGIRPELTKRIGSYWNAWKIIRPLNSRWMPIQVWCGCWGGAYWSFVPSISGLVPYSWCSSHSWCICLIASPYLLTKIPSLSSLPLYCAFMFIVYTRPVLLSWIRGNKPRFIQGPSHVIIDTRSAQGFSVNWSSLLFYSLSHVRIFHFHVCSMQTESRAPGTKYSDPIPRWLQ